MEYTVLPMDRSHLPAVAAIERACFSAPWTEEMLAAELYNDCSSYLVAQSPEGTVLGYAGLHVILDEGYITNIATHPTWRRNGVARRLLDTFCRFGGANLAFLTLEVRPSNTAAVAFYQTCGFAAVGRRKDYYTHPREDALLMTLTFDGK